MRKSTRYSLLLALALLVALGIALWLRNAAPPEVARLLPESDAIVYANLTPLRKATHFDRTPVARSPEFQAFIDQTGIVPERDLDAAAFALHRMEDPRGPNGPVAYSEVFEGRFDGAKLNRYLGTIASTHEDYAGHTIYTIPIEARNLRIVQLGYDTVAASNMPTPEQIHEMLDRYRAAASPFAGSSLLAARYRDVPLLARASAWGIGHVGLPFSERGSISILGLQLPLPEDTTFVASLGYGLNAINVRIEEIAASETEADQSAASLKSLLHLFQAMPQKADSNPGAEAIRQLTGSIKVEQQKDRAIVSASVPLDLAKRLVAPAPDDAAHP